MDPAIEKVRDKVWPIVIDLWIATVLILFFWLRVAGSNTGKHLLKLLGMN
jgi:hypothetical protein